MRFTLLQQYSSTLHPVGNSIANRYYGLELFRQYVIVEVGTGGKLEPKKTLKCRHEEATGRPQNVVACKTSGSFDQDKAACFNMADFLKRFRVWLNARADVPEDDLSDSEPELHDLPDRTISKEYAKAQAIEGRGGNQRVHVLTYLYKCSSTFQEFDQAYHQLIEGSNSLEVAHLCGCGLCIRTDASKLSTCTLPAHLVLIPKLENLKHIPFHVMARHCADDAKYQQYLVDFGNIPEFAGLF